MRHFLTAIVLAIAGTAGALAQAPAGGFQINCDAAARYSDRFRGEVVLVVHEGQIVCEHYRDSGPEDAWEIASGVKSFAGAMAAAAVQDGLMTLDEPVADTITEWAEDDRLSQITIRQLLSLVSGLNVRLDRHHSYAGSIEASVDAEPGQRFAYGPRPFAIFGEIMQRKLIAAGYDLTPSEYFRARVLIPIEADVRSWSAFEGDSLLSEGVEITPIGWARFGYLVLHGGEMSGLRLLDEGAVASMFEQRYMRIYGMGWWLHHRGVAPARRVRSDDGDIHAASGSFPTVYAAMGSGDQRLYLMPEYDLVIVRMTRGVRHHRSLQRDIGFSGQEFLRELLPHIRDEENS